MSITIIIIATIITTVLLLLRTNVVDTNGAAAKEIYVKRLGKKLCPGTFGMTKLG